MRRRSQYPIESDNRSRNGTGSDGVEPGALLVADVLNVVFAPWELVPTIDMLQKTGTLY